MKYVAVAAAVVGLAVAFNELNKRQDFVRVLGVALATASVVAAFKKL